MATTKQAESEPEFLYLDPDAPCWVAFSRWAAEREALCWGPRFFKVGNDGATPTPPLEQSRGERVL